ncbi:MAG TPA: SDR family oxidoreductase [Thermodesulfobacteriaceae bacterium]|nr:SDR family oxidoreductase [Thermodesulfobacteriaceae bacterium]
MNTAVVTGATSGIGLAISEMLLGRGFTVYGIGRDFSQTTTTHRNFKAITCDLTRRHHIVEAVRKIKSRKSGIYILVNNAGIGYFKPHEEIGHEIIHRIIATNLEAPLVLTSLLQRDIRRSQGYIINISSITALKASPRGCAYAATKAGLLHFSRSLFEEVRKQGIKVATILPDMTKTPFFKDLEFREGEARDTYITPECVAKAVETVISQRKGTIMTEIVLRPQKHMITKK